MHVPTWYSLTEDQTLKAKPLAMVSKGAWLRILKSSVAPCNDSNEDGSSGRRSVSGGWNHLNTTHPHVFFCRNICLWPLGLTEDGICKEAFEWQRQMSGSRPDFKFSMFDRG